jgi:hypothetical protein
MRTSITSYVYYATCCATRLLRDVGRHVIMHCARRVPYDAADSQSLLILQLHLCQLFLSVGRCRPCRLVHEVFRAVSPA